jgi:CspA family cold shock protein
LLSDPFCIIISAQGRMIGPDESKKKWAPPGKTRPRAGRLQMLGAGRQIEPPAFLSPFPDKVLVRTVSPRRTPCKTTSKGQTMRQTGTVKFFNASKGYGFITPDDGGKDVFVHVTAVERSGLGALADGQRVSFETEPDKRGKGPKAVELLAAS